MWAGDDERTINYEWPKLVTAATTIMFLWIQSMVIQS